MNEETPGWLVGILNKRSTKAVRILLELIEVGLRNGKVSANDVTVDVEKSEANVIGAVFKILPRFGFVHTDLRVKTTDPRKHGRRVDVWDLQRPSLASQLMAPVKRVVTDRVNARPVQGSFL